MEADAPSAGPTLAVTEALRGIRILDLSDETGALCGKLLADMGADVIKVESPNGDKMRRIGPSHGEADPHRSPFFSHYNTSKRGITLDIAKPRGRELFRQLAQHADVVIETFPPGTLAAWGLSHDDLRTLHPRLIVASLTAFGQTGPRRHWQTSDTVAQAVGGMLQVNGHPHEPPLRSFGLQAYHSASTYTAIAVMLALLAREHTGRGQWIDVSLQECVAATVEHVSGWYHQSGRIAERQGSLHWSRTFRLGEVRDGFVLHSILGDWTSLIEWVKADGKAQDLTDPRWEDHQQRRDECEHVFDVLDAWGREHTVAELVEGAQLRRLPYAPVVPTEALLDNPQLLDRGFFVDVRHEDLGRDVRYPGAPYRFSATPWRIRRRAPHLGEHNAEIFAEIGIDAAALRQLQADGVV